MNKDKILIKMKKGVIINEVPHNNLNNNDNLINKNEYIEDKENEEDNDEDYQTNVINILFLILIEQISGFWLWVLIYGIYAYFVQENLMPVKIAFIMLIINIIFTLKNKQKNKIFPKFQDRQK